MKYIVKMLLIIVPGIVALLLLFSTVWNYIVKTHLNQFGETVSSRAALEARQEAAAEKAAYQTAEYRTKRVYLEAQNRYKLEKIRLRIEMLPRYATLKFYSIVGILTILSLSLIIISSGYAGAKILQASVCIASIGKHSTLPVHY